jgi:hypothetical protein
MILSNTDRQLVDAYRKSNTVLEGDWWSYNTYSGSFNESTYYRSTIKK